MSVVIIRCRSCTARCLSVVFRTNLTQFAVCSKVALKNFMFDKIANFSNFIHNPWPWPTHYPIFPNRIIKTCDSTTPCYYSPAYYAYQVLSYQPLYITYHNLSTTGTRVGTGSLHTPSSIVCQNLACNVASCNCSTRWQNSNWTLLPSLPDFS